MTRTFAVTFDYLCPFARNAHEHVVVGLRGGADWDVSFVPFSLKQSHVAEGDLDVWERDDVTSASGVLALLAGIVVREEQPDRFLEAHLSLFAARHDDGEDLRDGGVVRRALRRAGVDDDAVMTAIADGDPLRTLAKEHEHAAGADAVFGVPTFIAGDEAVFVRLMRRPEDADDARETVERVLDLLTGWTDLNEFKRTRIPR